MTTSVISSGAQIIQPISRVGEEIPASQNDLYGKVAFYDNMAAAGTAILWTKADLAGAGTVAADSAGTAPSGSLYSIKVQTDSHINDATVAYASTPIPYGAKKAIIYATVRSTAWADKYFTFEYLVRNGTNLYTFKWYIDGNASDFGYINSAGAEVDLSTAFNMPTNWFAVRLVVDLENLLYGDYCVGAVKTGISGTIAAAPQAGADATIQNPNLRFGVKTLAAANKNINFGNVLVRWE